MKNAVFAGTFDPVTKGHEEVIKKASLTFDSVTVAILINPSKTALFKVEDRLEMLREVCKSYKNVEVEFYDGMLVDFMKKKGAIYNVRGVRNSTDFEYENKMHHFNSSLYSDLITMYFPCSENLIEVSSTKVRKDILNGTFDEKTLSKSVIEIIKRTKLKDNK